MKFAVKVFCVSKYSVYGKPFHRFLLRLRHAVILFRTIERQPQKNKPDGVNPNSNNIDYCVRKNEGKIPWFSADCTALILVYTTKKMVNG